MTTADGPQPRFLVLLGGEDITPAVQGWQTHAGANELTTATLTLDPQILLERRLDLQGELTVRVVEPVEKLLFTGSVLEAVPVTISASLAVSGAVATYALRCLSSANLAEATAGEAAHSNLPIADLLHILTRRAGTPKERLQIEGDRDLPAEIFEVLTDVLDVQVLEPTTVAGVRLLPGDDQLREVLSSLEESPLCETLLTAQSVAVVYVEATLVHDAYEMGRRRIDEALAWLGTRAQDGTLVRAGQFWSYRRAATLARPERGELALVRGLLTGRRVLYGPAGRNRHSVKVFPGALVLAPPLAPSTRSAEHLAHLAWVRAPDLPVFEQRVQALFDCLEFYASTARPPKLFDGKAKAALKAATENVELSDAQRERVRGALDQLNSAPLMAKVVTAASEDGVALTTAEADLIASLRRARNKVSHGAASTPGREEDLRHALSIVARLLAGRASATARPKIPS
jgi:hypothetical protein